MRFKPLQEFVAQHYEGGEFIETEFVSETERCGDSLFRFCILEAGDAHDADDFHQMLENAICQLRSLQGELT